jgi:galactose mutarotase-like enzyme
MKRKLHEHSTHERNYGCRIREYLYRDLKTVVLENELLRIAVLADKGADIFEFLYKPLDLDVLWHSFNGVRSPRGFITGRMAPGSSFLDFYEGGWQELFPSIDQESEYLGAPLGTHGEVCLLPWEYRIERNEPEEIRVRFQVRTVRTPFLLVRTLVLKTEDPTLFIEESVTNEGGQGLQFMWGHHPAFGPLFLDDSCRIEIPAGCPARTTKRELGPHGVLPRDVEFEWPFVKGLDGKRWDLSRVPPPDSRIFQMFYLHDLPEGRYGLCSGNFGVRFELTWDRGVFPILWVWAPYGGAVGYPWYGRNFNLALEPWSTVPSNLDQDAAGNAMIPIASGQTTSTSLRAAISRASPEGDEP